MIDVHCHILPGIDDGAKDFKESLTILRKAEKAGITDIILTPHYIRGTKYDANNTEKWELFKALSSEMKKSNIKINIFLGNEIYIDQELPEMLDGYNVKNTTKSSSKNPAKSKRKTKDIYEVSTLNSKKYILIELPVQYEDLSAPQTLFELITRGYVPVIAHPERYIYIQDNLKYAEELVRIGCVLQGDYLALTGKYGKKEEKTLKKLLKMDKIFCLASDIHHARDDYDLELTEKKLQKILKKDQKKINQLLVANPKKILLGK